ncbi:MAG: efflux RND transporter periplasmic adaptor subunit [bacterium]
MRKISFKIKNLKLLYLFLFIFFILFNIYSCNSSKVVNTNTDKTESKTPVLVIEVKKGSLSNFLDIDAKVVYKITTNLGFKINGKVSKVYVSEGQYVKKGQILAELDTESINYQIKQAYEAYNSVKSNYEQLLSSYNVQKVQVDSDLNRSIISINQAKANLELTKTVLYQTKKDFERYTILYNNGAISTSNYENIKVQYQNSLTNYYNALYALEQAKENYNVAKLKKDRLKIIENQVNSAYYNMQNLYNAYQLALTYLNDSKLISPIGGVVLKKNIDIGSIVSPSLIAYIIGDEKSKVIQANISDTDSKKISVNSLAYAYFNNKQYTVKVSSIYPALNTSSTYILEAKFLEPNNLNQNDYLNLKIITLTKEGFIIPRQAIIFSENKNYVFIVKDNKAYKKEINILLTSGKNVLVDNLEEGDLVVIDGQYFLVDGALVNVVKK